METSFGGLRSFDSGSATGWMGGEHHPVGERARTWHIRLAVVAEEDWTGYGMVGLAHHRATRRDVEEMTILKSF